MGNCILFGAEIRGVKDKGSYIGYYYSAISSSQDCSKRYTLYFTGIPGL